MCQPTNYDDIEGEIRLSEAVDSFASKASWISYFHFPQFEVVPSDCVPGPVWPNIFIILYRNM